MYADAPYSHEPYSTAAPVNAGVIPESQVVTASQGDVTELFTYSVTGQVMTATLGNETVEFTYRVSGQQIQSQQGMTSVRTAYTPTGQVINAQQGQVGTLFGAVIYPSGNEMLGVLASPTIETRYYLTGLEMRLWLGSELIWSPVDDSAPTIWVPVIVS